ncbi:MAG: CBS domain-containing protein [Deltaproteobacteria bacterium]|nr:CBS domain-containing protein [Deltaproteobacteria bacterium]MCW5805638.1 CBS domain-containing protein [Deltaproteobacteria bacterium]
MTIMKLLTPISEVHWLSATDTVRDAFDHMETHDLRAAPMLAPDGRYLGTVTQADLRRSLSKARDRGAALDTPLGELELRSHNEPVTPERDVAAVAAQVAAHPFVPVVDQRGVLLGVIDRVPHAA